MHGDVSLPVATSYDNFVYLNLVKAFILTSRQLKHHKPSDIATNRILCLLEVKRTFLITSQIKRDLSITMLFNLF